MQEWIGETLDESKNFWRDMQKISLFPTTNETFHVIMLDAEGFIFDRATEND